MFSYYYIRYYHIVVAYYFFIIDLIIVHNKFAFLLLLFLVVYYCLLLLVAVFFFSHFLFYSSYIFLNQNAPSLPSSRISPSLTHVLLAFFLWWFGFFDRSQESNGVTMAGGGDSAGEVRSSQHTHTGGIKVSSKEFS